ncbi:MAG: hypothetical protein K0R76_824 [Alphaproteobacteria bacterium]|nr:hypothetical protein [Alphaproteobacteria bacterium]
MPQSTPRPRSTPARPQEREPEARLRLSPDPYPQETPRSAYPQRHEEAQKIKSLSFWENTDQEAGEEDEWAERQSPAPFILVIIILVVASTLLWFLFSGLQAKIPAPL